MTGTENWSCQGRGAGPTGRIKESEAPLSSASRQRNHARDTSTFQWWLFKHKGPHLASVCSLSRLPRAVGFVSASWKSLSSWWFSRVTFRLGAWSHTTGTCTSGAGDSYVTYSSLQSKRGLAVFLVLSWKQVSRKKTEVAEPCLGIWTT